MLLQKLRPAFIEDERRRQKREIDLPAGRGAHCLGHKVDTRRIYSKCAKLSDEHTCGPPMLWQIRQVLETLSTRGDLVFPKTVDGDAKRVRSLLVAMWVDGLVTWVEESNDWAFRITDDGRAALAEATCLLN